LRDADLYFWGFEKATSRYDEGSMLRCHYSFTSRELFICGPADIIKHPGHPSHSMEQEDRKLGYLGFVGCIGFFGIIAFILTNEAAYLGLMGFFAFFYWFTYLFGRTGPG
jgi:hypothetical protein